MRSPRFVHVGMQLHFGVDRQSIEQAIDSESLDWMRYAGNCWILWTPSDCETIARKLMRIEGVREGTLFVSELNMLGCFGLLNATLWEWVKKNRGPGSIDIVHPPD